MTASVAGRSSRVAEAADVVVVGGGNAALCAALAARKAGADVLLLERAPENERGGNSRYTRNIRCTGDGYSDDEFLHDLEQVTGSGSDPELTAMAIRGSAEAAEWMEHHGARWQPALRGTLQLTRTNRFFLGGGKALINAYYARAARDGVRFMYDTCVDDFIVSSGRCQAVQVSTGGQRHLVSASAVVVASGGFEANVAWLARYSGAAASNYIIRGTRFNDGIPLAALLRLGAVECGNPHGFHAVAVDARSPQFDGGIVTRVDAVPFGITVNRLGRRFADEGEDLWPKRYASWGRLIADQPDQLAYTIFDSKTLGRFVPPLYPPLNAESIRDLAHALQLEPSVLEQTVREYNGAVGDTSRYDPTSLDGCSTTDLAPPKSNWALPIDSPPFYAYPLRTGITFTYLGVSIDASTRVRLKEGAALANVFAAGELMAGNILLRGYLAGFGMTLGTVFGRLAGTEAAIVAAA
jgi:tricarballylate dehydrogenase